MGNLTHMFLKYFITGYCSNISRSTNQFMEACTEIFVSTSPGKIIVYDSYNDSELVEKVS